MARRLAPRRPAQMENWPALATSQIFPPPKKHTSPCPPALTRFGPPTRFFKKEEILGFPETAGLFFVAPHPWAERARGPPSKGRVWGTYAPETPSPWSARALFAVVARPALETVAVIEKNSRKMTPTGALVARIQKGSHLGVWGVGPGQIQATPWWPPPNRESSAQTRRRNNGPPASPNLSPWTHPPYSPAPGLFPPGFKLARSFFVGPIWLRR